VPEEHLERLRAKAGNARAWVRDFAPEAMRFTVLHELTPEVRGMLSDEQRAYLGRLAEGLSSAEWEGGALQDVVFNVSKELDLKARDAFGAIYISMLGGQKGPRAGFFLASMDRDWVLDRLSDAATGS
jgi:lysyl-tRNA synthetase class 1